MIAMLLAFLLQDTPREDHRIEGPGIACGNAFAIQLEVGETLAWTDAKMDFVVYRFIRPDGTTVIYEGNAPQPGGIESKTGMEWPSVVAVHGTPDVARRVKASKGAAVACHSKGSK
jgi:hypothetical protein